MLTATTFVCILQPHIKPKHELKYAFLLWLNIKC